MSFLQANTSRRILFLSRMRPPRHLHDKLIAALFLAPSLIFFAVFFYYVLAYNLFLSFTSWNFVSPTMNFVGLDNYLNIFSDPETYHVLFNTAYFAVGEVGLSMAIGLGLALLMNQQIVGRGIFRTLFYFPNITTTSVMALLWMWIFYPGYGILNYILGLVGIDGPRWLTDSTWAMPAIIIMSVWRSVGYTMIIYLGGLANIPREYYEASQIDGANRIQSFWHITLPLLSPITFFLMITSLIGALQLFDAVAVMTGGGPVGATRVFNYYIYEEAFVSLRAGYSSALASILFVMILGLTLFQSGLARRWVHYQN